VFFLFLPWFKRSIDALVSRLKNKCKTFFGFFLAFFGLEFAWISCACIKTGKQTQDFF